MQGKYFVLDVVDNSYKNKAGEMVPKFTHYFRDGNGQIVSYDNDKQLCQPIDEEILRQLPKALVTVRAISGSKDGKPYAFFALEDVQVQ